MRGGAGAGAATVLLQPLLSSPHLPPSLPPLPPLFNDTQWSITPQQRERDALKHHCGREQSIRFFSKKKKKKRKDDNDNPWT